MKFTTINIQGNIFTSEILDRIRQDNISYQKPQDFGLKPNELVRDEISNAWSLLNTHWHFFKQKRNAFQPTDNGVTETRKYWILPLLNLLGYEVSLSNAEIVNGKSYAISHRANNKDGFPIHIVGSEQLLDKKAESGPRLSPHALMQEYINSTEHIYGFATNGIHFRVLRDATRLSRLSYLEFNLEQMVEEGHYAEFAILYRLLHASRLKENKEEAKDAFLEYYHNEALASGSRIRERLSQAVEKSIQTLANGLLKQPENENLLQKLESNSLTAKQYYLHILRSVYRILFLLVIEERNLIYKENLTEEEKKLKDIYYKFYSIQRLTYLVNKAVYIDPKKTDLWQSLLMTFRLFEDNQAGKELGIDALGSGIFNNNAIDSLKDCALNNKTVLEVFKYLVTFENENKQLVRVNYADLDVEEFGSVYEGLLEFEAVVQNGEFYFKEGDDRSSSGSHYTPEELVKPLIIHSLDYIIADKLKEPNLEQALLNITVCDVACGSGHILLSAARRIGFELARVRSNEDQPTPSALRIAIRDVIKNCIYGVDLNPMAVELCKVALWLEAHEPGQPLNFLDHHIKCGNAIVGLSHFEELENGITNEAFKTLPGDDKEIATAFKKRNDLERKAKGQLSTYNVTNVDDDIKGLQKEFITFSQLPENTPEQIIKKEKAYEDLTQGKKWFRLKQIADLQVAQFFIPKTEANKEKLTTHAQYMSYLKTEAQILDRGAGMSVSLDKHFFHWFLEFPQVFQNGGFDCILGNPPYKGGSKLSTVFGDSFTNYISVNYNGVKGMADLVSYFIRRYHSIIKLNGFLSIITTNKVSEGKTRESSLDFLLQNDSSINFAIKSKEWPGTANVHISIFSCFKGKWNGEFILDNKVVNHISSLFSSEVEVGEPHKLVENSGLSYTGTKVYGEGFIINDVLKNEFVKQNQVNESIIKRFVSGDDLNSSHPNNWKRWAIDVNHLTEIKLKEHREIYEHLHKTVYPSRQKIKTDKNAKDFWWKYQRERKELYDKIKHLDKVIVMAQTSKHIVLKPVSTQFLFSVKCIVFSEYSHFIYANIQSTLHTLWAWKYGTTMGASTLQYSTTACFDTFPLATNININNSVMLINGIEKYQEINKCGLTDVLNAIHNKKLTEDIEINELRINLMNLDNDLVFAHGWSDIKLNHDFYELDYLPENDRVRYTIHPEARKEVLRRLLELNHKIHAKEVAAGLWDKKKLIKKEKVITTKSITKEQTKINQVSLFDIENNIGMKEFSLNEGIYSIIDVASIIKQPVDKVRRWFKKLSEVDYEGLDGTAKTDIENRRISFHGLIELVVIGTLLENGFTIKNIVKARTDLKAKSGKDYYPFATNNVKDDLKVAGNSILFQFPHGTVTLDGTGQYNLDIIKQFFKDIIFENDIAMRIIPQTGKGEIVIDPKLASGKPSFINHHDLEVEMIMGFYDDEDSITELMENYSLSREEIEAALNYCS